MREFTFLEARDFAKENFSEFLDTEIENTYSKTMTFGIITDGSYQIVMKATHIVQTEYNTFAYLYRFRICLNKPDWIEKYGLRNFDYCEVSPEFVLENGTNQDFKLKILFHLDIF